MSEDLHADVCWKDVPHENVLTEFAKRINLNPDALGLAEREVIVLPNDGVLTEAAADFHLFAPFSKEILVVLQEKGMNAFLYQDNKERRELILKSAEVVLPILMFVGNSAVSLGLGILASWIYDKWLKDRESPPPSIKFEYAEVSEDGLIARWRRIEGTADDVQRLLAEESNALSSLSAGSDDRHGDPEIKRGEDQAGWGNRSKEAALESLAEGKKRIELAKLAYAQREFATAEILYRQGLRKIREAHLWDPTENIHRRFLHRVGRIIHETFGCQLEFKDGQYFVNCPVMLSHSRAGFSVGGSGTAMCTICGEDNLVCPHVKGRIYDGVVCSRRHDFCNICARKDCNHTVGERYDHVEAFAVITQISLDHVALVQNPSNPLCVVESYSLSESELAKMLPSDQRDSLVYGGTIIRCHHCLECDGR
jgi:hypothetical protein